jgi:uncharacterized protein (DUF1778 family)
MKEFHPIVARQPIADEPVIVMSPRAWQAFCDALDAPPRDIPALRKLLTEPSIFDAQRKSGGQ